MHRDGPAPPVPARVGQVAASQFEALPGDGRNWSPLKELDRLVLPRQLTATLRRCIPCR
jgi:hypothetical protein